MICTGQVPIPTSPVSVTTTLEVYLGEKSENHSQKTDGALLKNVSGDIFSSNGIFGDAFLVAAHLYLEQINMCDRMSK